MRRRRRNVVREDVVRVGDFEGIAVVVWRGREEIISLSLRRGL